MLVTRLRAAIDPQQAGLDLDEHRDPVRVVGLQVDRERVGQALREGFQDLVVDVADIGPDAGGRDGRRRGGRSGIRVMLRSVLRRARSMKASRAATLGASSIVSASSATSLATPKASQRVTVSQCRL